MISTPYVEKPPLSMILNRVSLFARYAGMSIMGLIFILYFSGYLIPIGWSMFIFNTLSAISVMIGKYRIEYVSLLPSVGMNIAALTLLASDSTGVVVILLLVASITMVERFTHLNIIRKTLRLLPPRN